mgnify:FL=1
MYCKKVNGVGEEYHNSYPQPTGGTRGHHYDAFGVYSWEAEVRCPTCGQTQWAKENNFGDPMLSASRHGRDAQGNRI